MCGCALLIGGENSIGATQMLIIIILRDGGSGRWIVVAQSDINGGALICFLPRHQLSAQFTGYFSGRGSVADVVVSFSWLSSSECLTEAYCLLTYKYMSTLYFYSAHFGEVMVTLHLLHSLLLESVCASFAHCPPAPPTPLVSSPPLAPPQDLPD